MYTQVNVKMIWKKILKYSLLIIYNTQIQFQLNLKFIYLCMLKANEQSYDEK